MMMICVAALAGTAARSATTIDSAHPYAWAGNIGWTNWRGTGTNGVAIGEYVCSGFVWSSNCGWINLGDGNPANGIRYSNTSGSDFGVNLQNPYSSGGVSKARLRGYAYAANLGWINFEDQGNPEISLQSGRLSGYVWVANCGWINLEDASWFVQSMTILPGSDSDDDGIADAFEFEFTHPDSLTVMTGTSDSDGDGQRDIAEYLAGTNPTSSQSFLTITSWTRTGAGATLTWDSSPGRIYRISSSTGLFAWERLLDNIVPDGGSTSRSVTIPAAGKRFFRVEAFQPLAP